MVARTSLFRFVFLVEKIMRLIDYSYNKFFFLSECPFVCLHDHVIVRNLQSIAGQALNNKIAEIITVNIYYEELASLIRVGDVQGVP